MGNPGWVALAAIAVAAPASTDATILCASSYGCEAWTNREIPGFATQVAMSPDGALVFTVGSDGYPTLISAFDAQTGRTPWMRSFVDTRFGSSYSYATGIAATPTRVLVSTFGREEFVALAYDPATGAPLWESRVPGTWRGAPAASRLSPDGTTFVEAGGIDRDFTVAAFDTDTGATRWVAREFLDYTIAIDVAVGGGRVIALAPEGHVRAYDEESGATLWAADLRAPPDSFTYWATSVAVSPDGGSALVAARVRGLGYCGGLYYGYLVRSLDASAGSVRWQQSVCGDHHDGVQRRPQPFLAITQDRALVAGRVPWALQPDASALDLATGSVLWSSMYPSTHGYAHVNAARVSPDGTRLYLVGYSVNDLWGASTEGFVLAIDTATGSAAWTAHVPNPTEVMHLVDVAPSADGSAIAIAGGAGAQFPHPPGYLQYVAVIPTDTGQPVPVPV